MSYSLEFELEHSPTSKGRTRIGGYGQAITPHKTRLFENAIGYDARKYAPPSPIAFPIAVTITFMIPRPKKPRFTVPAVKPDVDNLQKALLDGLNRIIWLDDSLIVDLRSRKEYIDAPVGKIRLRVEEVPLPPKPAKLRNRGAENRLRVSEPQGAP